MHNINFVVTNILIVSAVVAILVLRWRCHRKPSSQWMLSYPVSLKILSIAGLFFVYTGVSVLSAITPGWAEKTLVIILSLPAGVLVFMAAAEIFASSTSYDDTALSQSSPWRPAARMQYDDIVRIENALLWIQFAVHSRDGQVVKVCKWTERADEIMGYAEEGLESSSEQGDRP